MKFYVELIIAMLFGFISINLFLYGWDREYCEVLNYESLKYAGIGVLFLIPFIAYLFWPRRKKRSEFVDYADKSRLLADQQIEPRK